MTAELKSVSGMSEVATAVSALTGDSSDADVGR